MTQKTIKGLRKTIVEIDRMILNPLSFGILYMEGALNHRRNSVFYLSSTFIYSTDFFLLLRSLVLLDILINV